MEFEKKLSTIEALISSLFEKYKHYLNVEDKELCEEYLYRQGEYEEAISLLLAGLRYKNVDLDKEEQLKITEIYSLMGIEQN